MEAGVCFIQTRKWGQRKASNSGLVQFHYLIKSVTIQIFFYSEFYSVSFKLYIVGVNSSIRLTFS